MSGSVTDNVPIEELGLSHGIYLKLKRHGINYLKDIDLDYLSDAKFFGEKTIFEIEEGISRVRK